MKSRIIFSNNYGFTLIEILITLVIMSIGIMAISVLQVHAIKGNRFSKALTAAVSIGEEKLEQIKNTAYANIQSESPTQISKSNGDLTRMNFTRQVTVTNNTNPANTKTVKVTVTWTHGSKSYTVPISTLLSQ